MHGDYVDAILRAYHHSAKSNPRFSQLRRDGLKEHCLDKCSLHLNSKDEIILRNFFGVAEGQKGYLRLIKNCSADKFRPVIRILEGKTANPNQKYLELLAWMFDITPRPYNDQADYTHVPVCNQADSSSPEILESSIPYSSAKQIGELKTGKVGESIPVQVKRPKWNWRRTAVVILVTAGLGTFGFLNGNKLSLQASQAGKCMYWTGDRYEKVDCNFRTDGLVLPFDQYRYENLRRITDPGTITRDMISKVYYRKKNNKLKFYTSGGADPEDMEGNLRPMSLYIFERYISGQKEALTSKTR